MKNNCSTCPENFPILPKYLMLVQNVPSDWLCIFWIDTLRVLTASLYAAVEHELSSMRFHSSLYLPGTEHVRACSILMKSILLQAFTHVKRLSSQKLLGRGP